MMDTALFFVPANIGTSEAGHTYISLLLKLGPAVGLSVAIIKRFRRLFWMGVGIILLYPQIPHKNIGGSKYGQAEIR
jgi:hypothetical protein